MRKNTRKAITSFFFGGPFGRRGDSISTDGRTLYSYHTPIARRDDDLTEVLYITEKFSPTTTQQQNALQLFLSTDLKRVPRRAVKSL